MAGIAEKIYTKMPVLIQHAMVSGYGLYWNRRRFGQYYQAAADGYRARERFTSEEWQAYTQQKLREFFSWPILVSPIIKNFGRVSYALSSS